MPLKGAPLISAHLSTQVFVYQYALDIAYATVQASLSGAHLPNCAITGYAIEGELLTSVHLSTEIFPNKSDAVSALCVFLENFSTKSSAVERAGCQSTHLKDLVHPPTGGNVCSALIRIIKALYWRRLCEQRKSNVA